MNKKSASASKSIVDGAKALIINSDDSANDIPVIVIESESK